MLVAVAVRECVLMCVAQDAEEYVLDALELLKVAVVILVRVCANIVVALNVMEAVLMYVIPLVVKLAAITALMPVLQIAEIHAEVVVALAVHQVV